MKNKLKLTTALVGSLVAVSAGSALAQQATTYYDNGGKDGTTVSGNMNFSYRDVKNAISAANSNSIYGGFHGFGKEVQININNRGKLNNGWGYAAGFSIEADGTESNLNSGDPTQGANKGAFSGVYGENNFIDIIIGNTTLTVSADHIQNPDSNPTLMGAPSSYIRAWSSNVTAFTQSGGIYPATLNSPYEAAGVGIIQNVPGVGSFSALYVPNRDYLSSNKSLWGNDNGNNSVAADYQGTFGSAYEIGFMGDLGVSGLKTSVWYNNSQKPNIATYAGSMKGEKINAVYSIPGTAFTVAGEWAKDGLPGATPATGGEATGKSAGLSYAVTKDFTIAGTYARTNLSDSNGGTAASSLGNNKQDEKISIISAGYSLGPVALKGQFRNVSNVSGNSANGGEKDFLVWSGVNF